MQTAARVFKPLATRLAGRGTTHAAGHGAGGHSAAPGSAASGGGATRGIHIPSSVHPPRPRFTTAAHAQRLLQQTRTAVNGFIQHVVGGNAGHLFANTVEHISLARVQARAGRRIQHTLSPGARFVLARPFGSPQLPRLPTVQRGLHDVGLGCARNFSTGRMVFHHVIENTSITTRALWDSDWEKHLKREQVKRTDLRRRKGKQTKNTRPKSFVLQPIKNLAPASVAESVVDAEELAHYFPLTQPEVVTYLQIALAPTPTGRLPYSTLSYSETRLLPLRAIFSHHASFQAHSHRVSQIFSKLDEQGVWDKGDIVVEPWGDTAGLCTELRVKFEGRTEEDVRELLGGLVDGVVEGIAIQEIRNTPASTLPELPDSLLASLMTTPTSREEALPIFEDISPSSFVNVTNPWTSDFDASSHYVMPTLDVSSSLADPQPRPIEDWIHADATSDRQSSYSDHLENLSSMSEGFSDAWSGSNGVMDSVPSVLSIEHITSPLQQAEDGYRDAISITSWLSFSSDFANRVGETNDFYA